MIKVSMKCDKEQCTNIINRKEEYEKLIGNSNKNSIKDNENKSFGSKEINNDIFDTVDCSGSKKACNTSNVQRHELCRASDEQGQECSRQSDNVEWSCKPNNFFKRQRQQPQYSLLFQNCQNLNCYNNKEDEDDDEISKISIYAMEAKMNKANNSTTLNVRSNYSLKTGPVSLTPINDKRDKQLIQLETSKYCNKRATITIFNNTPLSQRIIKQELIGHIEFISTDEIFTPNFKCTGDKETYGEQKREKDTEMSHIFSTLVSVNQQENIYEIDDGIYVAGPKPEEYETNKVMPGSTDNYS